MPATDAFQGDAFQQTAPSPGAFQAPPQLTATGIASAEAFGASSLLRLEAPQGVVSAESFGSDKAVRLAAPGGVTTGQALGTDSARRLLEPGGAPSAEAFGSATIVAISGLTVLTATGVASSEALGVPRLLRLEEPAGVASAETPGTAGSRRLLGANGVTTGETFGAVNVQSPLTVVVAGIPGGETFGSARIEGGAVVQQRGGHGRPAYGPALDKVKDPPFWKREKPKPLTPLPVRPLARTLSANSLWSSETVATGHKLTPLRSRDHDLELLLMLELV